jgi:hypothetical protein
VCVWWGGIIGDGDSDVGDDIGAVGEHLLDGFALWRVMSPWIQLPYTQPR